MSAPFTLHAAEPAPIDRARAQRPRELRLRLPCHPIRPLMLIRVIRGCINLVVRPLRPRQRLYIRAVEPALVIVARRLVLLCALLRLAERVVLFLIVVPVRPVARCLFLQLQYVLEQVLLAQFLVACRPAGDWRARWGAVANFRCRAGASQVVGVLLLLQWGRLERGAVGLAVPVVHPGLLVAHAGPQTVECGSPILADVVLGDEPVEVVHA